MEQSYEIGYTEQYGEADAKNERMTALPDGKIAVLGADGGAKVILPHRVKTMAVYTDIPPCRDGEGRGHSLFVLENEDGATTDCMIREDCDDIFLDYLLFGNPDMDVLVVEGDYAKQYKAKDLLRELSAAEAARPMN